MVNKMNTPSGAKSRCAIAIRSPQIQTFKISARHTLVFRPSEAVRASCSPRTFRATRPGVARFTRHRWGPRQSRKCPPPLRVGRKDNTRRPPERHTPGLLSSRYGLVTDEDLDKIAGFFRALDKTGDGKVEEHEILSAFGDE